MGDFPDDFEEYLDSSPPHERLAWRSVPLRNPRGDGDHPGEKRRICFKHPTTWERSSRRNL